MASRAGPRHSRGALEVVRRDREIPTSALSYFVTRARDDSITTKVPGSHALCATSRWSSPTSRSCASRMRSFDRQWIFKDPRLIALERPALWASLSSKQVFLTTMTTTSLGSGPAATLTTAVPDKHHFRGSYGGKDVVPLYRDAKGTPNVDPSALKVLSERLGAKTSPSSSSSPTPSASSQAPTTPSASTRHWRLPARASPHRRPRAVRAHGGARREADLAADLRRAVRQGQAAGDGHHSGRPNPPACLRRRSDIKYDPATETLRVADGVLTGVPEEVWKFEVSGMDVIPKWLGYRMAKPAGRAASSDSPLDHIRPTTWSPEWSTELVEIVASLRETLALVPDGIALLTKSSPAL